jgi:hypothetical protein
MNPSESGASRKKSRLRSGDSSPRWSSVSSYQPTSFTIQVPVASTSKEPVAPLPPASEAPRWLTIRALALRYKDIITEAALRHLVWQAEAYAKHPKAGLKSNGFLPVIVRPPGQRKVLLDCVEFEKWLTSSSTREGA